MERFLLILFVVACCVCHISGNTFSQIVLERNSKSSECTSGSPTFPARGLSECSNMLVSNFTMYQAFIYFHDGQLCKLCDQPGLTQASTGSVLGRKVYTDCADAGEFLELIPGPTFTGIIRLGFNGRSENCLVYCDAGYTVIQRRFDGSLSFDRPWSEYKEGFGDLTGEMWLGNDCLHFITNQAAYELKVQMTRLSDNKDTVRVYPSFSVGSEEENYKLSISAATSGEETTSMKQVDGYPFTTKDADSDAWSGNCATSRRAGWWYKACNWVGLNNYYPTSTTNCNNPGVSGSYPETMNYCMKFGRTSTGIQPLKGSVMKIKRM